MSTFSLDNLCFMTNGVQRTVREINEALALCDERREQRAVQNIRRGIDDVIERHNAQARRPDAENEPPRQRQRVEEIVDNDELDALAETIMHKYGKRMLLDKARMRALLCAPCHYCRKVTDYRTSLQPPSVFPRETGIGSVMDGKNSLPTCPMCTTGRQGKCHRIWWNLTAPFRV